MTYEDRTELIEGGRILPYPFRNFSGERRGFNKAGERNFAVALDRSKADKMAQDGWNVKFPESREEGDDRDPFLKVKVSYAGFAPPKVIVTTSEKDQSWGEDNINLLDSCKILSADMYVNPFHYKNDDGTSGISAYLNELYVTIEENYLSQKHARIREELDRERAMNND